MNVIRSDEEISKTSEITHKKLYRYESNFKPKNGVYIIRSIA